MRAGRGPLQGIPIELRVPLQRRQLPLHHAPEAGHEVRQPPARGGFGEGPRRKRLAASVQTRFNALRALGKVWKCS